MRSGILPFACLALLSSEAIAGLYADAGKAVVQIHAYGTRKTPEGGTKDFDDYGTGFIVSPDGLILTAGHMVPDSDDFEPGQLWIEARLAGARQAALEVQGLPLSLEIVNSKTTPNDVALLRIKSPPTFLPYLRLCDQYDVDDALIVLGYSGGKATLSKTQGSVKIPAVGTGQLLMQMPLSPGDSGGPVFNPKGAVFGVAIGQERVNGERLEATTLAEMVPVAISILSPSTEGLVGVSYDPDCSKLLRPKAMTLPYSQVQTSQFQLAQSGQEKTILHRFTAPTGYRFKEVKGVELLAHDPTVAQSQTTLLSRDRRVLDVSLLAQNMSSVPMTTALSSRVIAILEAAQTLPVQPAATTPEPEVRSFAISRTFDKHAPLTVTRQTFTDTITAPAGFNFNEIVDISYQSLNHSPTKGAAVRISPDRRRVDVQYELESGPLWDRWRGWIDAIVVAKIVPDS